ncbi:MAG: efflux RND transporter permease subunit [Alphaproteobacteria bacterium]|nr:efflux RND transporter permease subunit [Alphaproteobacteria bacterium]MBV8548331.1 efflux RND transporter permease subunit [Alphaproteobacteria bacterium]
MSSTSTSSFTDIFVRRPVLATVISLMILVIGLRALMSMPVLQFPHTENAVVTVSTTYYGADSDVVAGFITTPLENAIAQANGIDYMTSVSQTGTSTITVYLRLNYDSDKALTEISTKISSVVNQLPAGSQQPVLSIQIGQTIDAMYIGFNSDTLPQNNITDYLVRVVQPRLQSVEGVQTAEILGAQNFALRAWLDPQKLAAYGLTAADISNALAKNDYVSGLGNTKGQMVQINLNASTDLHSLDDFRNLIVKQNGSAIVRLKDVANVTLGSDDYESHVGFDGKQAVYIGIQVAPAANLLDVIDGIRKIFPDIQSQLPQGIHGNIVYDSTAFVKSSIHEVVMTLIEALLIVSFVVFAFLGSPRAVAIPTIAIPLSLIGAFIFMLAFHFSINLLTLLALVLGIGLVVDDAIIVVENVNRHIEEGMKPVDAALQAARELTGPIIAMTIVLVAVYVPIGFQGGLTGALFTEFAFTLVGAVTVSAVIALTLSPMMSSKFLKAHNHGEKGWEEKLVEAIDRRFDKIRAGYEKRLRGSLRFVPVTITFAAIILGSIYFLYSFSKTELAPQEDQGVIISLLTAAPDATLQQRLIYGEQTYHIFAGYPETAHVFQLDSPGQSIAGMVMKPWDERTRTSNLLQPQVQRDLAGIAGVNAVAFQPPPLPGARGLPIQFVIQTTQGFDRLNDVAQNFLMAAMKSGQFIFLDKDLKIDSPQATVVINREKAAEFGLTMNDVGSALSSMLGGGYVNYFSLSGRSYKVIPQVEQRSRLTTDQLNNYYIHTAGGATVALSTLASIRTQTVPETLNHFQQMNAATISGVAMPGIANGDALKTLRQIAAETLPEGYNIDFGGQSRQFAQESSAFVVTFAFALIIIFLSLAAQFESFRDPLIILISVPMSIAGALIFICLGIGGASVNIYTQVGLVTLMGLISKHGILITEFANNLQASGRSKTDAIVEAAAIRLRPILMTTAAMVLGVVPLITSTGAGALSRFNMGLVIAAGLSIGTLFTLFVVPAVYMVLAADHHKKKGE